MCFMAENRMGARKRLLSFGSDMFSHRCIHLKSWFPVVDAIQGGGRLFSVRGLVSRGGSLCLEFGDIVQSPFLPKLSASSSTNLETTSYNLLLLLTEHIPLLHLVCYDEPIFSRSNSEHVVLPLRCFCPLFCHISRKR